MKRSSSLLTLAICALLLATRAAELNAQNLHRMTKDDVERWVDELSNWGRWGKDDQLGALNLITPEKRRRAALLN